MRGNRAVATLAVFLTAGVVAAADGWTQWRGSERNVQAPGFAVPAEWPETLEQVWSVDAGPGLASPVVRGNRVFLLTRDGAEEVLTCHDVADGNVRWRRTGSRDGSHPVSGSRIPSRRRVQRSASTSMRVAAT